MTPAQLLNFIFQETKARPSFFSNCGGLMIDAYGIFQRVTNGLTGGLDDDDDPSTSLSEGGGKTLAVGIKVGAAELAPD
jgi:hypothetical protein